MHNKVQSSRETFLAGWTTKSFIFALKFLFRLHPISILRTRCYVPLLIKSLTKGGVAVRAAVVFRTAFCIAAKASEVPLKIILLHKFPLATRAAVLDVFWKTTLDVLP